MPVFDWNGYNDFARWVLEPESVPVPSEEVRYRNAISRGYYAMLHLVREFYKEKIRRYPLKVKGGNSHNQLINELEEGLVGYYQGNEEIAVRAKKICATLRTSLDLRNMADYEVEPNDPMDDSTARMIFEFFDDVQEEIDAIRNKYKEEESTKS